MTDTHIHIHLNGETLASTPPSKGAATPRRAAKVSSPKKAPRKASEYSKRYGAAFKKVATQHKTKSGSWKKGGFKRAQKAAHKLAKR